jgi:hypothetical protein
MFTVPAKNSPRNHRFPASISRQVAIDFSSEAVLLLLASGSRKQQLWIVEGDRIRYREE